MGASRSSVSVLANRYATAIFTLAEAAGNEADVVQEISAVAEAIAATPELRAALSSPLLGRDAKAELLAKLAAKGNTLTQQALAAMAHQGRAAVIPAIATALQAKLSIARGELVAQVESARPLTESVRKQLAESLSKATGKTVQLALKENPELLGGVAVQIGSARLDASLAAALNTMRKSLLAPTNA